MFGEYLSQFLRTLREKLFTGPKSSTPATVSSTSSPSESKPQKSDSGSLENKMFKNFYKEEGELKIEDYHLAASELGVELAAVMAVAEVESGPHGGFLSNGKPVILFERHKFTDLTGGRFVVSHPDLNASRWGEKPYGKLHQQWERYEVAKALDPKAAAEACSWGRFQIMGFNHKRAGFSKIENFVDAMHRSARDQLMAFVSFIKTSKKLHQALIDKDWQTFTRLYNGSGQVAYYSERISNAYKRIDRMLEDEDGD